MRSQPGQQQERQGSPSMPALWPPRREQHLALRGQGRLALAAAAQALAVAQAWAAAQAWQHRNREAHLGGPAACALGRACPAWVDSLEACQIAQVAALGRQVLLLEHQALEEHRARRLEP